MTQSNLCPDDWPDILEQSYPIEFGWIGVDNYNHVSYFSTCNLAFTPKKVLLSYEQDIQLAEFINHLPEISSSRLYSKAKEQFHGWHFLSWGGLLDTTAEMHLEIGTINCRVFSAAGGSAYIVGYDRV